MEQDKATDYFLMTASALSLLTATIEPQWYNSLMFIICVSGVVVHNALSINKNAGPTREEFDEMKVVISNLATQLKTTTNKITGLRMSRGLTE